MTRPALFPPNDLGRRQFQRTDLIKPFLRLGEPGTWWNGRRCDLITGCFPAVTMTIDALLTGVEPSVGDWLITVTPITTQHGSAAADHMAPASITIAEADADTLANAVLAAIAASVDASSLLEAEDLISWNRFTSYVTLSVSPDDLNGETLRFTSTTSGQEFSVSITAPAGNGSTITTVLSPSTTTLKVGFYVAIDRSKGSNGYNALGQPYLTEISASTDPADIVGPVYFGDGTEAVEKGFPYREFVQRKDVPLVLYGAPLAYVESAVAATSINAPVYARHTAVGVLLPGMAADAAGAAAGATANVWTGTPTVTNDTLYLQRVAFGSSAVTLSYTSDGTAADTEIVAGLLADLANYNGVGGPLYGIVGSGTTTLILTGPADGRGFTPTSVTLSGGLVTWVETTPEVSTHHLVARGDRFLAESNHVSCPVDVPHANA